MPRRVEDIIPSGNRSIRDIPVRNRETLAKKPELRSEHRAEPRPEKVRITRAKSDESEKVSEYKIDLETAKTENAVKKVRKSRNGLKWVLITLGIIIIIAGLGYIASTYFSRATFTIVPKTVQATINTNYLAYKASSVSGLPINANMASYIPYQIISAKMTATSTVPSTNGSAISTKAQGTVTLYNTYSNQTQRLIAGTRLSTDNGKIYRLSSSVIIPGSKGTGANLVPGTVTATVIADQPGEAYNITANSSISDLYVASYKGTPKYSAIYARLNTPIIGGYVGTKRIVSPTVLSSITTSLQGQITAQLLYKLKQDVPSGYVMYDNGYTSSFSTPTISGNTASSSNISLDGIINAVIFKRADLIDRLVGSTAVNTFGKLPFETAGLDALQVTAVNVKSSSTTAKDSPLTLRISGDIKLIGTVDPLEIKRKLAGKSLADLKLILKPYDPVIDTVNGELMPPWVNIPSDLARISINIKVK